MTTISRRYQRQDYNVAVARRAAHRHHAAGQVAEFKVCFCAALVVGLRNGDTARMADDLALSVDAIEARARAAVTWYALMATVHGHELRSRCISAKRELSWSHFASIGKRWKAYDLSPREVGDALLAAANPVPKKTSVDAMCQFIDAEHAGEGEVNAERLARGWANLGADLFGLVERKLYPAAVNKHLKTAAESLARAYKVWESENELH